jgi:predicted porin
MQKKLIALAVAALASGAAFAQSNVTIYGRIDYGFVNRGDGSGGVVDPGTKNEFASGVAAGSRIGFKGTEDLGNGWKTLFQAEFGIDVDSGPWVGGATWKNRNSYIGLTNATYGTFIGGRVDGARYSFAGKYDPFANGTVGNMASIQTHQTRADNAVAYISPTFGGGFSVLAAYSNNLTGQEAAANVGDTSLYAIAPMYDNGPISALYDHEEAEVEGTDGKIKINVLAGSYDFGSVKVAAYWEKVKSEGALGAVLPWDQKSYFIGATIPVLTNGKVKLSWGKNEDKGAATIGTGDCRKFAVGFDYALSKRTNVYTDYAKITNDAAGTCRIGLSGTTHALDNGLAAGYGTRGLDVGIAHTF